MLHQLQSSACHLIIPHLEEHTTLQFLTAVLDWQLNPLQQAKYNLTLVFDSKRKQINIGIQAPTTRGDTECAFVQN